MPRPASGSAAQRPPDKLRLVRTLLVATAICLVLTWLVLLATPRATVAPPPGEDELIAVKSGSSWGYMDERAEWIVPPRFDHAATFREGLGLVRQDGMSGYIDRRGAFVIPLRFPTTHPDANRSSDEVDLPAALPFRQAHAPVRDVNGKWGLLKPDGSWAVEPTFTAEDGGQALGEVFENLLWFTDGERYGYMDTTGQILIRAQYSQAGDFGQGLAAVRYLYRWGFIDAKGDRVIEATWSGAGRFVDGLCPVKGDAGWGVIDLDGNVVIEPKFESMMNFSEGFAPAQQDGLWGYLDRDGRWHLEPRYELATPFTLGLAQVWVPGEGLEEGRLVMRLINKAGRTLWPGL